MRSAKRTFWAVLTGVLGFGLFAVLGALAFYFFGRPKPVNPGAAVSELMNKAEPGDVVVAVGTGQRPFGPGAPLAPSPENVPATAPSTGGADGAGERSPNYRASSVQESPASPGVIVLAALPTPTAPGTTTTAPMPTATTVATPGATAAADESGSASPSAVSEADATAAPEPPPGAQYGVTYCGAITCGVGLKCCCQSCVPFDQACDPRSCAAQSGLSISVPCGMDLCDPGEVCCDARCGECARAGECPAEPCQ